jgi:tRNA-dihydrouridine synthase B
MSNSKKQKINNNNEISKFKMPPFIYMAPIRGITEAGFRNIFNRYFGGCDAAISPFINPQRTSLFKEKHLTDILPENNPDFTVIPQILHSDPEDFLALASRLEDLGYQEINWNLGCPSPMVTKKHRGSGLLPHPDKIISLLDRIMPRLKAKLSIKTRLGYNNLDEGTYLFPQLNDFPLKEIILHARLGIQLYEGSTNLDAFAACQELSNHQLVFNGDIIDINTFLTLQKRFPEIDRWMLGRGLIANPTLANEIKGCSDTSEKKLKTIKQFHDAIYAYYEEILFGPSHLLGKMKQIWEYLILSFPKKHSYLKKIRKAKSKAKYEAILEELFINTP